MFSPPDGNISSNSILQIAAERTESLVEGDGFSYTFENIQKKKYILTLMGWFSILMMTVPIHDKSAKTVVSRWIFLLGKCVCTLTVFFLLLTTINQFIEHIKSKEGQRRFWNPKELRFCHKLWSYNRHIFDDVNLWYFKLLLFDLKRFIVWNIWGPRQSNAKV